MRIAILLLTLLSISSFTQAQWYHSQGKASTQNIDNEIARKKAIEDALHQSLLIAGASVSSVKQVVNGLLMQDEISIRASGIVNSLEIVNEVYANDTVTVTIRADIFEQEHQCMSADYRKSLLITQANIIHREQANIGKIYPLGYAVAHRFAEKVQQDSRFIDVEVAAQNKTKFSRLNNSLQAEKIQNLVMALADLTSNQYIMFAELTDLSMITVNTYPIRFWKEDSFDRRFDLSVFIYNGINGEKLLQKRYTNTAPWTFNNRDEVDVNSTSFWQSDYGSIIDSILAELNEDLDEKMMCQVSRGKIVQINDNTVTMNIGKRQGIQVGDVFTVLHLSIVNADNGKNYSGYNISPYKVKVTQVSNESAKAINVTGGVLGSVQINDFVVRY